MFRKFLAFMFCALPLNAAMNFDGLFSHVISAASVSHGVGTGDFTWCAWVFPTTVSSSYDAIMSNGGFVPGFYIKTSGTNFGAFWDADLDSGTNLTANTWQHVVFMRASGTGKFYLDGVQTATTHDLSAKSMSDANFYVGFDAFSGDVMTGQIDDARFYRRALSDAEIQSLALSRVRVNITDGLFVYWPMDEGVDGTTASGTGNVIDRSGNGNGGTPTSNPGWRAASWIGR